ncbi:hypothetical protein VNO78_08677 [Psophocarpus tetragonolobus]|uniref:Uncharacterized protein n=1 Tax=Psophocarpus tetragonolobus TaxID=3891 RepID=A0AAN9T666_PSOTE
MHLNISVVSFSLSLKCQFGWTLNSTNRRNILCNANGAIYTARELENINTQGDMDPSEEVLAGNPRGIYSEVEDLCCPEH